MNRIATRNLRVGRTLRGRAQRIVSIAVFFVLALAASSSVLTANTSWASGVSVSSDTQAMANEAFTYPLRFDASLQTSLDQLITTDPAATPVATEFYAGYVSATKDYGVALLSAAQTYTGTYKTNAGAAKSVYLDSFGNARANYFNKLEAARNVVVSELSGTNDVAKDTFVNHYNAARDIYNNQLEIVKNQVASL